MYTCASCGRPMPCGCPNPVRRTGEISSYFGIVCGRCDAYNDSGREVCVECAASLTDDSVQPLADAAPPLELTLTHLLPLELTQAAAPAPLLLEGDDSLLPLVEPDSIIEPLPLPLALEVPVPGPLSLNASMSVSAAAPKPSAPPLVLTNVVPEAPAATLRCSRCNAENPPEFRFCTECGMTLRAPEPQALKSAVQPITVGKAAARVLRGDRLGQTLGIGMQATAGRGPSQLSFPGDPFLAPIHCSFLFQGSHFFVRDETSPSGTFVRLRDEEPLGPGDCFAVGDHLLRYVGALTPEAVAPDGTRILGCPRPPGSAVKIEELHEGLVPGRASLRLGPSLVIGRDDGCDLSFSGDPFVSGRHSNITVGVGGRARVRDLGSTNGTFRRLAAGSERELLRGDCIRIGSEVLQLVEAAAPPLAR